MDPLEVIAENIASQDPILDLGGLGLTVLPAEVGQATHLTQLSLRGNQLLALPAEIGLLVNLKFLSAADNQLESLPPEIGDLIQMTRLNLKNNMLSKLPIELLDLDQLELLRLDRNDLDLPDDIIRKWDRPADILDYYRKHCLPKPEPIVLSVERKIAMYFDASTLNQLVEMLCVPAEEFESDDHELKAARLMAYHTEHGLEQDLLDLLAIYRPNNF